MFFFAIHPIPTWRNPPLFHHTGTTILVDPWLVGDLTFGDTPWLYKGSKRRLPPVDLTAVCKRTAAILISQALPDHAHGPTLAALPCKDTPVVCSPSAEGAVRAAGFVNVFPIAHGQSVRVAGGKVGVAATAGALVGPPGPPAKTGLSSPWTVCVSTMNPTATHPRVNWRPSDVLMLLSRPRCRSGWWATL